MAPLSSPPSSILIIGSGAFGLSTALALTQRPTFAHTSITVLERSATFPPPNASSTDSSRIVRADYASPAYARLAARAQDGWRRGSVSGSGVGDEMGGGGRYTESGLVLVATESPSSSSSSSSSREEREGKETNYVRASWQNVQSLQGHPTSTQDPQPPILELPSPTAIASTTGTGGAGGGTWGYLNRQSGWADAAASMVYLRRQVAKTGRVRFVVGTAVHLIQRRDEGGDQTVHGALLSDGKELSADLTIVAAGAYSPSLVDLRGRVGATAQVLAYLALTPAEEDSLRGMPVLLNMSSGLFVLPPKEGVLKVARHAYGYANIVSIPDPDVPLSSSSSSTPRIKTSLPHSGCSSHTPLPAPEASLVPLRAFLGSTFPTHPTLATRAFKATRLCWYADTPRGDFLVCHHPRQRGLFLATGGSGHAFKFVGGGVLGEGVVDVLEGRGEGEGEGGEEGELRGLWGWKGSDDDEECGGEEGDEERQRRKDKGAVVVTEDGSRGGERGLMLEDEYRKESTIH